VFLLGGNAMSKGNNIRSNKETKKEKPNTPAMTGFMASKSPLGTADKKAK
jgi:hypothetical protein